MPIFFILVFDNLKTSIRTKKAIIFLVLYLFVFGLIMYAFFHLVQDINEQIEKQGISELQQGFISSFARGVLMNNSENDAIIEFLFTIPVINIILFFVSLIGTPLLLFILNYDKVSQEIYDGTIRYLLFRASRFQIFFAKFVSGLLECSLITFVAMVLGVLWGSMRFESVHFAASIVFGLRYWLIAQFFLTIFIALTLMASSIFKKPFTSLIVAFTSYIALAILPFFVGYISPYDKLYFEGLFMPTSGSLFFSIGIYMVFTAIFLTFGYQLFKRKDL